jgi:hypothetical protein
MSDELSRFECHQPGDYQVSARPSGQTHSSCQTLHEHLLLRQEEAGAARLGNLAAFMFHGCKKALQRIHALGKADAWLDVLKYAEESAELPRPALKELGGAIGRAQLKMECDFVRRIVGRLSSAPYILLWIAYAGAEKECPRRLAVPIISSFYWNITFVPSGLQVFRTASTLSIDSRKSRNILLSC